ncbi:hypothetical protein [Psychroserpens mesophilus]|uniref:hypothetical protein n=1 Tax=Psychroserpens mesophilus TaxID=325473 RepID=UPI003D6523FB
MSISDTNYKDQLIRLEVVDLGKLYFFKDFLVAEFNEGVTISFDNFDVVRFLIKTHYKDEDFGFIANRIHSYSIAINDAPLFNSTFKNLKAYATVTYTSFASKVFEMENYFFKFNRQNFKELDSAIDWVKNCLNDHTRDV